MEKMYNQKCQGGLNFDDTEEEPPMNSDQLTQHGFDNDFEKLSLYQPKEA